LLVIVATPRILFRFIDEQVAQPIRRGAPSRNTGRMYMETFCRVRKHPRSRPLLRPEANPAENAFVVPHKFAEEASMTLRVNLSCENFHARDPCFLDLALVPVCGHQFASLDTRLSKLLRKRHGTIISRTDCSSSVGIDALPEILFALFH